MLAGAALACSAWGGGAGCGSLRDVDARIERELRLRGSDLGAWPEQTSGQDGASDRPRLRAQSGGGLEDPALRSERPASTNPGAGELRFRASGPEDDTKAVEGRLRTYAGEASGAGTGGAGPSARQLDLTAALMQAQRTARELLTEEEEYMLTGIRLLIERHRWDPILAATVTAEVDSVYAAGSVANTTALSVVNTVSVTQRLPWGGQVAASYLYTLTEQLREAVGADFTSSNQLVLSGTIPLLRGAGDVAREDLIQAEREMVYAARRFESFRRELLVSVARDYFDLVRLSAEIDNQQSALELLRKLEQRTGALVEAGREAEFQRNIAASETLRATSQLAALTERYVLALDRFKVRLGIGLDEPVRLVRGSIELPTPSTDQAAAAETALRLRLDLQTSRDRADDAKRAVRNAENGLLPDLNAFASASLTNNPTRTGLDLLNRNPSATSYSGGLSLSLPLDRETERLGVRAANIRQQQQERSFSRLRDDVVVEARSRVREIDRARFALALQERAVEINLRRRLEQELKADEVTPQQVVETARELQSSQNARDQAAADLRNAVLDYLLSTGQLRVRRDGTLEPLPGMAPAEAAPTVPVPVPEPAPVSQPVPASAPGPGPAAP